METFETLVLFQQQLKLVREIQIDCKEQKRDD